MSERLKELMLEVSNIIDSLDLNQKIEAINNCKLDLHKVSPFNKEPVDCVIWVKNTTVQANDYNPNNVAKPEMDLLKLSIGHDGYTQPIVSFITEEHREVVDGFHRHLVGKTDTAVQERVHGYLPVVTINSERTDKADRMASTIRHNRARGKHNVEAMSDMVVDLKKRNWSDEKIAKELGMDSDEVLKLCQISGLANVFEDNEFSQAWEMDFEESINIE